MKISHEITLFTTAFLQVAVIAINTWQIANEKWIGSIIGAFLISFLWSFNIKKIAFGNSKDRIIYAFGAAIGTLAGMSLTKLIY